MVETPSIQQPTFGGNPITLPYLLERRPFPGTSSAAVTARGRRAVYIKPQSQDMIYEHGGGEEAANEHTHDRFVDSHNADGLSLPDKILGRGQETKGM